MYYLGLVLQQVMKVRRKRILVRRKSYNKFGELTWFNKEQDITTETQATTTESPTETFHLITETTTDTTETIFKITCYSEII